MTKKDFVAKLAQGVRHARQSPAAVAPEPLPVQTSRAVRQTDLSPSPTLDRPWDNLHPQRIWPD